MGGIFISYRREDSQAITDRIYVPAISCESPSKVSSSRG